MDGVYAAVHSPPDTHSAQAPGTLGAHQVYMCIAHARKSTFQIFVLDIMHAMTYQVVAATKHHMLTATAMANLVDACGYGSY